MKHNTVVRMVTDLGRGDIGNICSRQGHIARAEKVLPQINKGKIVTLPRKWSKDKSPQFMEEETHHRETHDILNSSHVNKSTEEPMVTREAREAFLLEKEMKSKVDFKGQM